MALSYEATLAPVTPHWRSMEAIEHDLLVASDSTTNEAKAELAEIERLIRRADREFATRRYEIAVTTFKEARAKIYRILNPRFSVGTYLATGLDKLLPLNAAIERQLVEASVHLLDAVRPTASAPETVLVPQVAVELPPELAPLVSVGFQEVTKLGTNMKDASGAAAGLLAEGKPHTAVRVLEAAIAAVEGDRRPDGDELAVLHLNLAASLVQTGESDRAGEAANVAAGHFRRQNDAAGEAQALHVAGVAAKQRGDAAASKALFEQAATRIKTLDRDPALTPGLAPAGPGAIGGRVGPDVAGRAARSIALAYPGATIAPSSVTLGRKLNITSLTSRLLDRSQLQEVLGKQENLLPFRTAGRDTTWGTIDVSDAFDQTQQAKAWAVGVPSGNEIVKFRTAAGNLVGADQVSDSLYYARINKTKFDDIRIVIADTSTTSVFALHLYAYVLPVKIGDCYHQLGRFANAEANYRQATEYTFLNRTIEASIVWTKLARNALDWGVVLYKEERIAESKSQFEKLAMTDSTVPNSFLYTTTSLNVPAQDARQLIVGLGARPLPAVNRTIAYLILRAGSHLRSIAAGLDYYGLMLSPIHTFEYLQSVSQSFCKEAIQAEREFVNFKSREEYESATRRDLENTSAMAQSEADARFQMYQAAQDDVHAAESSVALATRRRNHAITERAQYAATSSTQIWAQAASQALLGGEDGMYAEISALADRLERGETISGAGPLLAAAQTLLAGRKSREYELQRMQNNIDQLTLAIDVAQVQLNSARDREEATELYWRAALEQIQMANEALDAFDAEFFTPDAWSAMASVMRNISRSYLERAIRIAKLMERAYNFENDENLHVIKAHYGHGVANAAPGRDTRLLAGDALLVDVESFTYHAITHATRKNSRIKDVVSLAGEFPAQFESFLDTGLLEFETDLYEFDRLHPGFFEQRIEAVELEVVGLLGDTGLNGTLTGGGVSSFRKRSNTVGSRAHVIDTMALSNFELRNDIFLYTADTGIRGLFQGLGVGGTWQLHLPRRSNDFDFRRIFDIRLAFYYKAKYDAGLRTVVLALPVRPGELTRQRNLTLRYDFPASWYAFYASGVAAFKYEQHRFPANQTNFQAEVMRFRVMTMEGVDPAGIELQITAPGGAVLTATTGAGGLVSSEDAALSALAGVTPIGDWQVSVVGGPSLMGADGLDFARVHNIQISIDYTFAYLPEVI